MTITYGEMISPIGAGIAIPLGDMQRPDVVRIIGQCQDRGLTFPREETTFFAGRDTLETAANARWRKLGDVSSPSTRVNNHQRRRVCEIERRIAVGAIFNAIV